jgi:fructosamine-3-kinase
MDLFQKVEQVSGVAATGVEPLSGGCIGEVYKVRLADGTAVVAKVDDGPQPKLAVEGFMLRYLAEKSRLPVPAVLSSEPGFLLMAFLSGRNHFPPVVQEDAAELLAALHSITEKAYGFEQDTLIGGLYQPNPWYDSWVDFFREQRLLYMSREAMEAGRLPVALFKRLEAFSNRLEKWLPEPEQPSLIHGDAWSGNILASSERITGFVDPAIYYADPEIELAFTTLFGTFGEPFFERYSAIRPLRPGFQEERRDIYNLYPLLVHVRLFGGSYVSSVDQTLHRFGG